jgi:thiol-disulfide isomerase/thioredoxin
MRIIHILAVIIVGALPSSLFAQDKTDPLKIGDPVPDIIFENIINHPRGKARLSDFKDQLLILDFWATWCRPCIEAIPRFEQLQAQFGKQLQILLVTSQHQIDIAKFVSNRGFKLPSVTDDQKLSKLFPHKYVPHEVWIKDGKVIAITGGAAVTSANIKAQLSGKAPVMDEKKSNFDYDLTQPLLVEGNGGKSTDLLYHSVFTGYLDGIGGGGVYTDRLNRFKIRALNGTVLQLYLGAMRYTANPELSNSNRCIIEFEPKEVLPAPGLPAYSTTARGKYYCYELIVPIELKDRAGELMLEDLNRFFGARYHLCGTIEKRTVKCWALRKTNTFKGITSSGLPPETSPGEQNTIVYRNQPFSKFYQAIVGLCSHDPLPVIDQTGITSNIDITVPSSETDILKFSASLEKYGLYLEQDSCLIDMLVIKQFK